MRRGLEVLDEALHIERWMLTQDVLGLREDIFDVTSRHDAERDFAIDSAESKVVDAIAERGNVWAFGRIHVHRKKIISFEIQMRCQFEGKGRVAALVLAQPLAVDPHS